jgi:hypothetical protein
MGMKAIHATRKVWLELTALLAVIAVACLLAEPALGQGRSTDAPGAAPCSPSSPPGSPGSPTVGAGEAHNPAPPPEDLSNRLARSDGVICPPAAVDPEMKLPTPQTGNMPVIPPPGSPGGDPSVRPK